MSCGKGEVILRATPGRSTPFELSAVDESDEITLPRIPTAFWIIDRDLRITTAYGSGFDSLSLHPERETVVGLDLFEYFKTDDPEFESIAEPPDRAEGDAGRLREQAPGPNGRSPARATARSR
jgi:hypothetical protein